MNRDFFAIGMLEYGGVGLLMVVGLFLAALDLVRAVLLGPAKRYHVPHSPTRRPEAISSISDR